MKILVLGMHRSGTSTVAGLIHQMGAYVSSPETLMPATNDNPKGYFERIDVCRLNERILISQGCQWSELAAWREGEAAEASFTPEIEAVMKDLGQHHDWLLKDPRLSLTYPSWRPWLKDAAVVVVHRDPVEVARSLEIRDGIPLLKGIALWEYYSVATLNIARQHSRVHHLCYNELLADPLRETARLYAALSTEDSGLRAISEAQVESFVTRSLNRSKQHEFSADALLNPQQLALIPYLQGRARLAGPLQVSAGARMVMRDYPNSDPTSATEAQRQLIHRLEAAEKALRDLKESTSWRVGCLLVGGVRKLLRR